MHVCRRAPLGVSVVLVALLLMPLLATRAHAAPVAGPPPASLVIYPLPDATVQPYDLAVGPGGNFWSPYNFASTLARVTPTGAVTEFPQGFLVFPRITTGADGNLWMLDLAQNSIDKITTAGVVAGQFHFSGQGGVGDVTKGPDGNVWFTEINSGQIGRVTPGGVITEFDTPSGGGGAVDIVAGPDGNLWFTDQAADKIGRITPSGVVTEFDAPSIGGTGAPQQITRGADGNLWFTNQGAGTIGRITTAGTVAQFVLPAGSQPEQIGSAPDGNLWFTDWHNDQVGRITPAGQVGLFATSGQFYGGNIIAGPDGRMWFTLGGRGSLAAFAPFAPAPSAPDVRNVSPRSTSPSGGAKVLITGYNVGTATQVLFGGTPATSFTVVGPGQIEAVAPPHAPGEADVTVVTPSGTTAASEGARFFYNSADCGRVITRTTTLTSDLGPCYNDGVVIGADHITLDLGGKRIFGFAGPSDGKAVGVRLQGRTGVQVISGTVSGFDAGVVVNGGSANTLAQLIVKDNVGPDDAFTSTYGDGIFIDGSPGNRILGNTITHNGIFDGIGINGPLSNANTIAGNVIDGTVGPSDGGPSGEGIIINGATGNGPTTFISSTRVENNVVRNSASAGIANVNEIKGSIVGNTVEGSGATNSIGNGIGVSVGRNWDKGPTQMLVAGNQIHGNGVDGIRVGNPFGFATGNPTGNKFLANDVADNATNPAADTYEGGVRAFDLHDLNKRCADNLWRANKWGSGGFSPACTTTGGSGPPMTTATSSLSSNPNAAGPQGPDATKWEQFLTNGRSR